MRTQRFRPYLAALAVVAAASTAVAAPAASPLTDRYVAENGATVLVSEQRSIPLVDVELLLDAGSRRDPRGAEGLASLTASLLMEGTQRYSSTALAEAIDSLGAEVSAYAGIDIATVRLRVLRDDLDAGLRLLAEVLLRPSFPEAELRRRRTEILAGMRAAEDRPGHVAYRRFLEQVFGADPYGHPTEGTPESVAKIRREDVVRFYRDHFGPERAIVTVVGDIDTATVQASLHELFGGWTARTSQPFEIPQPERLAPTVSAIRRPLSQTTVLLGHRGIRRADPDYYAVEVMNHILGGGGFGSRLLDSVRTEAGLAYSINSGFSAPIGHGSFRISMQTKAESTVDAVQRTCREILRMRAESVSDEELESAKLYLTGNFPLQLDSNRKIAAFLAEQELFALGPDFASTYRSAIDAVTKEDVLRVAQLHIRPDDLHLILVGPVEWTHGDRLDCAALTQATAASP